MVRRLARIALALALALAGCEGQGDRGEGLLIRNAPIAPNCTAAAGSFPSGLAVVSQTPALAALVQFAPPGLVVYGLDAERPTALRFDNVGTDSDGDGVPDRTALTNIGLPPFTPQLGELLALDPGRALVSMSNYEQVLVYDPIAPAPIAVRIEVPPTVPPERHPLLPAPGSAASRTGISTFACVVPPASKAFDSTGAPIPPEPACDPARASFRTNLTSGKAVAGGRLFVATSNLAPPGRFPPGSFLPGTVLVYDWIEGATEVTVRPSVDTPALFTSGFNPTGVARFETPGGRELVLVTVTGAIGTGGGAGNVLTDSALDVIDPSGPRIVATIPLERAGPSFDAPAVDPTGRVAILGSSSQRQVYAVDLRPLDDPTLYAGSGPPVVLDGLDLGYPDARIFSGDRPLVLPDRTDRSALPSCGGLTYVAVNARGTELFVTDFCDGTFTRIRMDLSGSPPLPYPRDRFQVASQLAPFAPNDAIGELSAPSVLRVRPGEPGIDYDAPDVLVLAGQPNAQLCALRVESF